MTTTSAKAVVSGAAMSRSVPPSVTQLRETLVRVVETDRNGEYDELLSLLRSDRSSLLLVNALALKVNHNAQLDVHFLKSMSDGEVAALARFLTLIDGAPGGIFFGSAPAVPTLVAELTRRNYEQYDAVIDWIFRNRTSPFLPFGSQFGSKARTLLEYRLMEEERRIRLERRSLDIHQVKVELRRSGCVKATHDLQKAIRRKDWKAFPPLIDRGADIMAQDGDGKTLVEKMDEITKAFCTSRLAPEESAK